jgi:hypothetical protein
VTPLKPTNRKPLPRAELVWEAKGKKTLASSWGCPRTLESEIASFALRISTVIAISPDGETSNGSQKYRALAPQEIADRSIAIAEVMFSELEANGHVVFVPPHDEWPNESEMGPMGFTPR